VGPVGAPSAQHQLFFAVHANIVRPKVAIIPLSGKGGSAEFMIIQCITKNASATHGKVAY
jgi:hypothetical protein